MPSVLFVCTANRFRSPSAAAIFKKALDEEENQGIDPWNIGNANDWKVGSAGLWTTGGQAVLSDVLETASQIGIDLSDHISVQVNDLLLAEYDLILVMEKSHKESLERRFPHLQEHIYLLSHVVDFGSYDIPDTYGSLQEVTGVIAKMNELIRRNLRYICILATALHNKRNRHHYLNSWEERT